MVGSTSYGVLANVDGTTFSWVAQSRLSLFGYSDALLPSSPRSHTRVGCEANVHSQPRACPSRTQNRILAPPARAPRAWPDMAAQRGTAMYAETCARVLGLNSRALRVQSCPWRSPTRRGGCCTRCTYIECQLRKTYCLRGGAYPAETCASPSTG